MPRRDLVLRCLAGLAIPTCLLIVWQLILPGAFPEVAMYRDDAYYYFEWAKNLAAGRGPVVSAGAPTSGLSLLSGLWFTIVSLITGPENLVVSARWSGLFCHLLTGLVLGACVRESHWLRVSLVCCYLSTPALLIEAQNGQDTALACLSLALLLRYRNGPARLFVALSILVLAARSDLYFFVVAVALQRPSPLRFQARLVAIPLCCYALWNVVLAGHPLQDSAKPIPWLLAEQFVAQFGTAGPSLGDYVRRYWWYGRPCALGGPFAYASVVASSVIYAAALGDWLSGGARFIPLIAVSVGYLIGMNDLEVPLVVAVFLLLGPKFDAAKRERSKLPLALGVAAIALVAIHEVVRFYPRDYYFAPLAVAGYVVLAQTKWERGSWLVILLALASNSIRSFDALPSRSWQQPMAMAGQFVSRFVPTDGVIGCFNSGIVSWHRDGPVLNLDGVVNRPAYLALRGGRLDEYLDREGVHWLLDNPVQFSNRLLIHANGRHFGSGFDAEEDLVLVARFLVPGVDAGRPGTESFDLYWRRRGGLKPPQLAATVDLGPAPEGYGHYIQWRGREGVTLEVVSSVGDRGQPIRLVTGRAGVAYVICVPSTVGGAFSIYEGDSDVPVLRIEN